MDGCIFPGRSAAIDPRVVRDEIGIHSALILREDMLATLTYTGSPGGEPAVDRDWAAGVAMAPGWIHGALRDDPLRGR